MVNCEVLVSDGILFSWRCYIFQRIVRSPFLPSFRIKLYSPIGNDILGVEFKVLNIEEVLISMTELKSGCRTIGLKLIKTTITSIHFQSLAKLLKVVIKSEVLLATANIKLERA